MERERSPPCLLLLDKGHFSRRRIRGRHVRFLDVNAPQLGSPSNDRTINKFAHRVHSVSKRAALASKRKLWDSNDIYDNAAQSAVDVFEESYHTTRSFLIQSIVSMKNVYSATKDGVQKIEHHLLVPVRDSVILPAFAGAEFAVDQTVGFLQSEKAVAIATNSFQIVKHTPLIGESILAPVIMKTWEVVKYPIPSRDNVRNTVDGIMSSTKMFLVNSWKEIYFYTKLVDASVTRALSHTQWRVLGFGPYSSLSEVHKREVIDHLCERYLATDGDVARYELACHIKFHNWMLYHDLIVTGILFERGSISTKDDVWLMNSPEFITDAEDVLLVDNTDGVVPLWCYTPNKNGSKNGAPWISFSKYDAAAIESGFRTQVVKREHAEGKLATPENLNPKTVNGAIMAELSIAEGEIVEQMLVAYPTIAQWYEPHANDVLIDEKRHAISFLDCCPHCLTLLDDGSVNATSDESCSGCNFERLHGDARSRQLSFPVHLLMRPTLWRFHGVGNEVRRGVWLLHTQRHGLQPYNDESASTLEEAYLYLKWRSKHGGQDVQDGNSIDNVLLTVQVLFGEETQLVQFRSLNQITAIQKSIAGGLSLFKRRVYRGIQPDHIESQPNLDSVKHVEKVLTDDKAKVPCILAAPQEMTQLNSKTVNASSSSSESVEHLVLVVHGIGEMLRSGDLLGLPLPSLTSSIIDCCDSLRINHREMVQSSVDSKRDKDSCQNGNVEYIPIEWHEPFAIQSRGVASNDRTNEAASTIADITLDTIPHLRNFANDTMLDILYFMSPKHHHQMIDIVTMELNTVVEKYRKLTGFRGEISILSHSLGSVICWDILSHQKKVLSHQKKVHRLVSEFQHGQVYASGVRPNTYSTTPKIGYQYPTLHFDVVNNFMIGSPVAVFIMMRNENNISSHNLQLSGCKRVFNIFHPYDPVAYRLEPLVSKGNKDVEPEIIPHWKFGLRVQYQTKVWLRKIMNETEKAKENAMNAMEASFEGVGLLEEAVDSEPFHEEDDSCKQYSDPSMNNDRIRGGRRLDYMLQEKELENANEYISALAAHSSYWESKDLSLFIAKQLSMQQRTDTHVSS